MTLTVGDRPFKQRSSPGRSVSTYTGTSSKEQRRDPLRRLTATPHTALLPVMGRTVLLKTNSRWIRDHLVKLFARYPKCPNTGPSFVWKIVSQRDVRMGSSWPQRSAFSDPGLRFAEFGQRTFLAVDLEMREAIGFVSHELCEDLLAFTSPFIDTLFYLTAGSLGLFPFASACVASGREGLLVLGQPNQGKTTASYLAAKHGLAFYADQAVFLEIGSGGLQAWSDFVPAAFRPEALQFLPELGPLTEPFSYCDFNFYYMTESKPQTSVVTPVCSVVLKRETHFTPCLAPLATVDYCKWISESVPFKDDDRFKEQGRNVLELLSRLPAYQLAYGSDPATAAAFFPGLLAAHSGGDRPPEVEFGAFSPCKAPAV